jgi:ABC-type phosphate transport system substrate-binding protein
MINLIAMSFFSLAQFISPSASAEEVIRLSVATSAQEKIFEKIEAGFTKESGIKIAYTKSARRQPTDYFQDVIQGRSDAAVASVSYEDWLELMSQEKIKVPDGITQRIIGRDLMKIIVNDSAHVKALNIEEIANIFSGRTKNWKSLTGVDLPIVLYSAEDRKDKAPFRKFAMKNAEFGNNMKVVPSLANMLSGIDSTPGSIGFMALNQALPSHVIEAETPPIGRPVTLITVGRPKPAVETLVNYIRAKSAKL